MTPRIRRSAIVGLFLLSVAALPGAQTPVEKLDYATIARKDRHSEDWYLGSVTDENTRTLAVPLDFLDPGRRYVAQIYRDGDDADWKTRPHSIAIEQRTLRQGETLTLKLAPGGGTAIRLHPAR